MMSSHPSLDLEKQNELLSRSLAEMQKVLRQYTDLYDFAPMGYLTLNRNGLVLQSNLSGAQLLGRDVKTLAGKFFAALFSAEFQAEVAAFISDVFASRGKSSCEAVFFKNERDYLWLRLEATYSDTLREQGGVCHVMISDVTHQKRAEKIQQARLRIAEFAVAHSLSDLLQNALDELCKLTESPIGFFHFVEPDQRTISLQAWSTYTLKEMCKAEGKGRHYDVDKAGVWVDCVRQRRPIIHNDYASLPHRKGLPEGHAPVHREMVFPITRNQKIEAIIGVGNKLQEYTEDDLAYALQFADLIWDITERKRAEAQKEDALEALRESEARYRSILEDQTELICRYLPDGRLSYVNDAYARYYGESAQKLINTNFIPHIPEPDLSMVMEKISKITPQESAVVYEHRIFKDGEARWQRWTHRGIYNSAGELVEHQAVGSDITEHKRAELGLHRYLSELKVLYDNGLAIGAMLEPREIGAKLIETLSKNLSWHHIVIRLRRGESDDLELIAFNQPNLNGQESEEAERRFSSLAKVHQGLSGWVVQTAQPIRSGNVQSHPQYVNFYSGVRSGMYMPLLVGERAIGCISVESEEEDAFTEQDERLLATLAAQTAIAFENARLYQNLQLELREREKAEEALRESEKSLATERRRLTDILKGTNAGTWEWNVQTGEAIFNKRWAEIVGYTLEELEPISIETWVKLAHPDDLKISEELLQKHFNGETKYYEMEARMRHKEGHWVWIIDRGKVATWTEDGKPLLMSGTHQDMTARKQAEEQIQFLAKLPSEDPNPVLRVSREGILLYVNEAGRRLLPQWNLQVGGDIPPTLREAVFQSMRDGKTQTLDLAHDERMFSFYVAPISASGYANLYGHDITESRQAKALRDAETRYHVLFDQSPYGVLLVDPQTGQVVEANEITSRQLGYTRKEFLSLKIADYEAVEDPADVAYHMEKIIREGSDDFETLHRTKTGEIRNVHVWVKTLPLGGRDFFYTIFQDITERKRMEAANEEYSREIALLEERQRIASDLHDAVSQTLFSARLTAEALLRHSNRQLDSFTHSLIDLNKFVRSASGEIRLVLVELRNNALVNSTLNVLLANLVDSGMARTNAEIEFQCCVGNAVLPAQVKIVFYRIAQEALNNAIKHAKAKKIVCILQEEGPVLEMTIQDDGGGFVLDEVSEDHFGIQIMHERAEQAGVMLTINTRPQKGTTVSVRWMRSNDDE